MINFSMKTIVALFLFTFSALAYSQSIAKPVQIIGIGIHYGGYVIYRFQIKNNGTQSINRIKLGYTGETDSSFVGFTVWPDDPTVELPMVGQWFPSAIISRPDGWGAKLISTADEGGEIGIDWVEGSFAKELWPRRLQSANAPQVYPGGKAIAPGQTSGDFSVRLEQPDYAYVQGYASVTYGGSDLPIPVEKGDITPPTLAVKLTPSTLRPSEKLVPITATITVKDDYDPAPEIKLESITPNELAEPGDIRDASLGTDDRQFLLKAEREGKNKTGRVYTVIYSATDASGNKAIATTTVTVLHDEREHADRRNEKNRKNGKD